MFYFLCILYISLKFIRNLSSWTEDISINLQDEMAMIPVGISTVRCYHYLYLKVFSTAQLLFASSPLNPNPLYNFKFNGWGVFSSKFPLSYPRWHIHDDGWMTQRSKRCDNKNKGEDNSSGVNNEKTMTHQYVNNSNILWK